MKASLNILRPLLVGSGAELAGRIVIGTVKGDLHDIGKNLVASRLEGGGFEVIDLGADVPPEKFVDAVRSGGAPVTRNFAEEIGADGYGESASVAVALARSARMARV